MLKFARFYQDEKSSNVELTVKEDMNSEEGVGSDDLVPQLTKTDMALVESGDEVLAKKMYLVNNAIDEIGFTWYHAKLFCIAGFGYSVDSQMEMIQSSVKTYVDRQFGRDFPVATECFYAALITGSILWGFSGDIIGRKLAFNTSLLLSAIFGFLTGGMGSYATYVIMMYISTLCAGGNIAMDVAVFMEYLPSKYQYLNTSLAAWWGVGQTIANLVAWAFLPNNSCASADNCPSHLNKGWRYVWYTNSGIVMAGAVYRLFFFKLDETPKFLVSNGRDEEAIASLQRIATKYNRTCSLTLEQLQECGELDSVHYNMQKDGLNWKAIFTAIRAHIKTLFSTKLMAWSTFLVYFSWLLIGISYSTFYNFLYIFIASHGGDTGSSTYIVYRNSSLANFVGIFGPLLAGAMILIPGVGRRGTMIFGSLSAMAILFAYTTVRTPAGDAGFSSATYFFVNIYYGCLYAYTPEVFPAQARGTGVSLALVTARISGAMAPLVYYFGAKSGSSVPIWVCGACIGFLSVLAFLMPFEPTRQRTV